MTDGGQNLTSTNFKKPKEKKCKDCQEIISFSTKHSTISTRICPRCTRKRQKEKRLEKLQKKLERKEKTKERKANKPSKLIKEADTLFSLAIRKRDGKCRRTGSTENLQCSHIYSRSNKAIRWDMNNALTLTAGQHLYWWHKEPVEAVEWARKELGEQRWAELKRKKNAYFKLTPEFIKERIEYLKNYLNI